MKYTAGQAGRAAGVSTATITRSLKKGQISGHKGDNGAWVIDASELHRVFPLVAVQDGEIPLMKGYAIPPETGGRLHEISTLEREVQALRDALSDAKEDRNRWRDMAERLSLAPQSPPAEKAAAKRGIFERLLGKK